MSQFADNKTQRFGWFRVDDKVKPNFGKMYVFQWIKILYLLEITLIRKTPVTKYGSSFSPHWLEVFGSATLVLNFCSARSFSDIRYGTVCLRFFCGILLHNSCQHFTSATPLVSRFLVQARTQWDNFQRGINYVWYDVDFFFFLKKR